MKYTNEELLKMLVDEYALTGTAPTYGKINGVWPSLIARRFGTWNNALALAKIPYHDRASPAIGKICPTCKCSFETVTYKEATYCSVLCSNVSRRKRGTIKRNTREEWKAEVQAKSIAYKNRPFEQLGWDTQRKRVISEQNSCCNKCGNSTWMGEPLSLEVDHKNGDNKDHTRSNLEALCPNCHSLTPTWKGRNKKNKRLKVSDEDLKMAITSSPSIRQALMIVGLSPRGQNYRRANRLALEIETPIPLKH